MKINNSYKLMLLLIALPALLIDFGIEASRPNAPKPSGATTQPTGGQQTRRKGHYRRTGRTRRARFCTLGRYGRTCRKVKVTPVVKTGTTTKTTTRRRGTTGRGRRFGGRGGWRRAYNATTRTFGRPGSAYRMY